MPEYFLIRKRLSENNGVVFKINMKESPGKRIEDLTNYFDIKYVRERKDEDSHYQLFEKKTQAFIMNLNLN